MVTIIICIRIQTNTTYFNKDTLQTLIFMHVSDYLRDKGYVHIFMYVFEISYVIHKYMYFLHNIPTKCICSLAYALNQLRITWILQSSDKASAILPATTFDWSLVSNCLGWSKPLKTSHGKGGWSTIPSLYNLLKRIIHNMQEELAHNKEC